MSMTKEKEKVKENEKAFNVNTEQNYACSESSTTNASAEEETDVTLRKLARQIPCLGILLSLIASILLGTAGMLVKLTTSVHGVQVSFFRALIQLAINAALIIMRDLTWLPAKGEHWPVISRSLLGGASITFWYFSLKLVPLGDATTIRFSLPVWALIVGYFFLNESCSFVKLISVFNAIAGVVMIAKPDVVAELIRSTLGIDLGIPLFVEYEPTLDKETDEVKYLHYKLQSHGVELAEEIAVEIDARGASEPSWRLAINPVSEDTRLEGSLLALGSSICLALSFVSLRLCQKTRAEVVIVWLSVVSMLVGLATLLAINEFRLPNNLFDVCLICLNGILGAIGQWLTTCSLKIEQSGIISLTRTIDIVVAFFYSSVLLNETVTALSLIGALFVSSGVAITLLPKLFCKEQEEDEDNENVNCDDKHSVASIDFKAKYRAALNEQCKAAHYTRKEQD